MKETRILFKDLENAFYNKYPEGYLERTGNKMYVKFNKSSKLYTYKGDTPIEQVIQGEAYNYAVDKIEETINNLTN